MRISYPTPIFISSNRFSMIFLQSDRNTIDEFFHGKRLCFLIKDLFLMR